MDFVTPKFVDHHPKHSASGYLSTNEEINMLNKILGDTKVERIACIASGGEVLLSVLLHRGKEIVAVDHSYRSLAISIAKVMWLQNVPTTEIAKWLQGATYRTELDKIWEHLPTPIQTVPFLKDRMFESYCLNEFKHLWNKGVDIPQLTKEDVDKITFFHGDLTDVKKDYGTFDLFYASNAQEHNDREGRYPSWESFANLLNPGGLLLYTHASADWHYQKDKQEQFFEPVKALAGTVNATSVYKWGYKLIRKKS